MSARRNQQRRKEAKLAKAGGERFKAQKQAGVRLTQRARYGTLSARDQFDQLKAVQRAREQGLTSVTIEGHQLGLEDYALGRAVIGPDDTTEGEK